MLIFRTVCIADRGKKSVSQGGKRIPKGRRESQRPVPYWGKPESFARFRDNSRNGRKYSNDSNKLEVFELFQRNRSDVSSPSRLHSFSPNATLPPWFFPSLCAFPGFESRIERRGRELLHRKIPQAVDYLPAAKRVTR